MEEVNRKKLQDQPMMAMVEEANAQLLFSDCRCTSEIKLNNEWQMTFLSKKVNMDFTDGITLFTTLHLVKNFKFYNKHQTFLARPLGFVTKKSSKKDIALQLNGLWQY